MATPYLDREKQLRSVFVGNIPFEATEAELREKFEQAGPIVSFRLVHDRESGKPKGYGFIEYQDAATANSCVRNLNNVEYNGRPLRVGPAAGDQNADIKALQQALGGLQQESPYGPPIDPVEAPEAISKAVSSLPPEQMFELMKQMKICIQNNPNEARNMLLQNPQLAYALLQAQIVMKIVDPQVAMALLHREREPAQPILNDMETQRPVLPNPVGSQRPSGGLLGEHPGALPSNKVDPRSGLLDSNRGQLNQPDRWGNSPVLDPRGISPRERGNNYNPGPVDRRDSSGASRAGDVDFRNRGPPGPEYWAGDPRDRSRGPPPASFGPQDPARGQQMSGPSRGGQPSQYPPQVAPGGRQPAPPAARGVGAIDEEKEKAALIVQVLQLTDEQIQQLPPDQRQSILILKQQIGAAR